MATRMIAIDFDVHKAIEADRKSFNETENDVLRRLLGIGKVDEKAATPAVGRAWASKGVVLPHGTELRMEYNGVQYSAIIDDGAWTAGGKRFAGPSPAAAAVATTRSGRTPSLNGWIYWQAKLPETSTWVPISTMRKGN